MGWNRTNIRAVADCVSSHHCVIEGCTSPLYQGRTMCCSHFMKTYRYGDPHYVAPSRAADLTGQRFGELTALRRVGRSWQCRCTCGAETSARTGALRRGSAISCGNRAIHRRKAFITYAGAHDRVVATKGRAAIHDCVDCRGPASEWSYDHMDTDELYDDLPPYHAPYSLSPDHYDPRCITCHRRFDKQRSGNAIAG